jgi:chromosome segregation ATPase
MIRHGVDELKRRWQRRALRKRLTAHDRTRATHLGHLGQQAVADDVDLSGHTALREQIAGLDGRAGGLAESTRALEAERQRLQDHRRAEDGRFDGQRSAIHAQKTPVDAALAAARQRLAAHESDARKLQSRLDALARELDQHRQTIASPGTGGPADAAARVATAQARVTELEVEQPRIAEELRATAAAQAPLADEVAKHLAESKKLSAQLDEVAAARKKALDEVDAALHRTATQLQATTKDAKGVEEEPEDR